MNLAFRDFLKTLEDSGELQRVRSPVDLRYVSALIAKADKALLFERIAGYDMPLAGGVLGTRKRLALGLGEGQIWRRMCLALDHSMEPRLVESSPVKEVILLGDEVDLTRLPIPVISVSDGGPYISSGVVTTRDEEYGLNCGMYRLMLRNRNTISIDIVTPNNLRTLYQRALASGKPLEVAISIGAHPYDMVAANFKGPLGMNELSIAGGLRGEPVELVRCETMNVECLANAEIVLEGKILPVGWSYPEGRFGEFTRLSGGLHMNPIVRIEATSHRRDAIFYALHMPWENIWLGAPANEAAAWRVLREAGVETVDVNVTAGGCSHWHVVASIKSRPGDAKNALLALLSIADFKHAIVTDEDINIFDPEEVEWALATRVQADKDVLIVSGARSKPLDPSLPAGLTLPTTAKMGIDATIPEGIPRQIYERIAYPHYDEVALGEGGGVRGVREAIPKAQEPPQSLAKRIESHLQGGALYFSEILSHFAHEEHQRVVRAMGLLDEEGRLERDTLGRYQTPPQRKV